MLTGAAGAVLRRASFDGKHPMRIERGGSVHFQTSLCPLPLINIGSLDRDWYEVRTLLPHSSLCHGRFFEDRKLQGLT